jgi:hypothetical protein
MGARLNDINKIRLFMPRERCAYTKLAGIYNVYSLAVVSSVQTAFLVILIICVVTRFGRKFHWFTCSTKYV